MEFTTLENGKPAKGIKITIYTGDDLHEVQALSTNRHGVALPRLLPPGMFHVFATGTGNRFTDLYLDVHEKPAGEVTPFVLDLSFHRSGTETLADRLIEAEKKPIEHHSEDFGVSSWM